MGNTIAEIIRTVIQMTVSLVDQAGYIGIFILMAIESSAIPMPSEIIMIPAGYLVYEGKMNMFAVIAAGTLGSLAGAMANYIVAKKLGRPFIRKYGKYIFIKEQSMQKAEVFFSKHGQISTFVGRLIPLIRQYISLPAGLANMNVFIFSIYTTIGALIWVSILAYFGQYIGVTFDGMDMNEIANAFGKGEKDSAQMEIKSQMRSIVIYTLSAVVVLSAIYVVIQMIKRRDTKTR